MMTPNFTAFPLLQTERLLLRQVKKTDAPEIFFLRSDASVLQYIDRPAAASITDAELFITQTHERAAANESIIWAITIKGSERLLGTIGLWRIERENYRAEIGYVLHPDNQRQGIMTEALEGVIEYGFQVMGLHSIVANINPANEASRGLLGKLGFQKEAYFRENYYWKEKFCDTEVYVLLGNNKKH